MAEQQKNWKIVGYDSEQMIDRVPEFASIKYKNGIPNNVQFISDWEQLKLQKFDKIMCIIVLQHIYEKDLVKYIQDFKKMSPFIFVHGRRYNDDIKHRSNWTIIEEQGLIPNKFFKGHIMIPYSSDGDPNEHNAAQYVLNNTY